jgi:hypothetical protein
MKQSSQHTHASHSYHKKKSSRADAIAVAVVWVVGVGAATSVRGVELVRLWVTRRQCMKNLHRVKNIKMKELKDTNDRKHTRAPRGDPKWGSGGELGTAAPEFLAAAPFAIHIAMQWISNLKDNLLLSECLSIDLWRATSPNKISVA